MIYLTSESKADPGPKSRSSLLLVPARRGCRLSSIIPSSAAPAAAAAGCLFMTVNRNLSVTIAAAIAA